MISSISLNRLLTSGEFGSLRCGITKTDVEVILGKPEYTGGYNRKNKIPTVYVYRDLEIYFDDDTRSVLEWAQVDGPKSPGGFSFPDVWPVEDWALMPEAPLNDVVEYCNENGIRFFFLDIPDVYGK